jgi:pterin-4a-carbinolamine dehydratase
MIDKAKLNSITKACVKQVPDWKRRLYTQLMITKSFEEFKTIIAFILCVEEALAESE